MKKVLKNQKALLLLPMALLLTIAACIVFIPSNQSKSNPVAGWPDDGHYFVHWDSYIGGFDNEELSMQLNYYNVHTKKAQEPLQIEECILIDERNGIELRPKSFSVNQLGSKTEKYDMLTLSLKLPNLDSGNHTYHKIRLVYSNGTEQTYAIGTWNFDIKPADTNQASFVTFGKKIIVQGTFENYKMEIKNNSTKDIEITDILYSLQDKQAHSNASVYKDFDLTEKDNSFQLAPGEMKTFLFAFPADENKEKFITLKPFLSFRIDGKQEICSLHTAVYPYTPQTDEAVLKLLQNDIIPYNK